MEQQTAEHILQRCRLLEHQRKNGWPEEDGVIIHRCCSDDSVDRRNRKEEMLTFTNLL